MSATFLRRVLIGMATVAAFAPAAVVAQTPAALTKVTIGYGPANSWIPAFVAKDQGIFAKHGLDATLQLIAIGSNQPAALMADSIQISGLNPTIVIFADEGGADIQVVANESIQTKTETDGGVIARADSGIHTPQDLDRQEDRDPRHQQRRACRVHEMAAAQRYRSQEGRLRRDTDEPDE